MLTKAIKEFGISVDKIGLIVYFWSWADVAGQNIYDNSVAGLPEQLLMYRTFERSLPYFWPLKYHNVKILEESLELSKAR